MTASMLALTSSAIAFVVLLLVVAWLLWRGHDVPVWLTCVTTLLLAAFTLVCVVLLMLPLLRLLEMAVVMWTLVFA
ncbi:histidine kinase [Bifidobacterium pseudocatenulatum]|uniref:histidine kinase n=1 Tax=Bifidobacterium pseudocatenulatum TaxID=28026 RepID=UPI001F23CD1E|nr:histidine kinase [Bifidobacterium pseudocatenulatum]UIY46254.1 histidine kinase [Bifidobacterium pseudocatenulatum]